MGIDRSRFVVMAAGGTGGHVFPALCLARELQKRGLAVIFATDKRGAKYLAEFKDTAIVYDINTAARSLLYLSLIYCIIKSVFAFLKMKPKIVIGFGGYPSIPFVFAAQILKIKTAIHEQNAVVGKANRLLSKKADMVFTAFEETKGFSRKDTICVGNPTRFDDGYTNVQKPHNDRFTILVFAGSQGAKIFSHEVVAAICEVAKSHEIKVFHQCRKEDVGTVQCLYREAGIAYDVNIFFDNIDELYKASDLVIARSGASTVFEIIGFRKPSILIPYKESINGDQQANAEYLKRKDATIVIEENKLLLENLTMKIFYLIDFKHGLEKMSNHLFEIEIKNASKNMTDSIVHNLSI
jgi:UDP-N-acetylglucosamine--N-acetylmuramyl-(pentapeptide) pyrophosphoryl-undecaprenol N-acetylglucosamine transferase